MVFKAFWVKIMPFEEVEDEIALSAFRDNFEERSDNGMFELIKNTTKG